MKITVNGSDPCELNTLTVTEPPTISTQSFIDTEGLRYFKEGFEKQLLEKLSRCPTFEHKCHNCGGALEMKVTEHIFRCPYCGSAYAIGTAQVNDRGGCYERID